MPIINPDLSSVGPIQPGTYNAHINKVDVQTSAKGNPMVVVEYAVNVNGTERVRTGYHVTSGGGAFMFDQLLRACGFDEEANAYQNPNSPNPPFNTDDLIGQDLQIVFESDEYQGNITDRIQSLLKK